jgi:hypothetical protein
MGKERHYRGKRKIIGKTYTYFETRSSLSTSGKKKVRSDKKEVQQKNKNKKGPSYTHKSFHCHQFHNNLFYIFSQKRKKM